MLRLLRPSRRAASTASWSGPALLGTPRAKASRRFCELNNVDIAETAEAEAEPESPDEDVSEARAAPSFTPFTDGDGVRTQGPECLPLGPGQGLGILQGAGGQRQASLALLELSHVANAHVETYELTPSIVMGWPRKRQLLHFRDTETSYSPASFNP